MINASVMYSHGFIIKRLGFLISIVTWMDVR